MKGQNYILTSMGTTALARPFFPRRRP